MDDIIKDRQEGQALTELQVRAIELSKVNREWLEWFIETCMSKMPALVQAPVYLVSKKMLGLERDDMWKLVPICIHGMDGEQFDNLCRFFYEFSADVFSEHKDAVNG